MATRVEDGSIILSKVILFMLMKRTTTGTTSNMIMNRTMELQAQNRKVVMAM